MHVLNTILLAVSAAKPVSDAGIHVTCYAVYAGFVTPDVYLLMAVYALVLCAAGSAEVVEHASAAQTSCTCRAGAHAITHWVFHGHLLALPECTLQKHRYSWSWWTAV